MKYREINKITGLKGTAVNVQAMVYGNYNSGNGASGTGVLFTRNPATGENKLYGEFLMDAQGEDVVAGKGGACGAVVSLGGLLFSGACSGPNGQWAPGPLGASARGAARANPPKPAPPKTPRHPHARAHR